MAFDPKKHVIRVQGNREYLPASARLVWFRQEHPDWGIVTTPVEINLAPAPELKRPPYAIFMAQVFNSEGKLMATAHKYEDVKGFPDFLEKAETGAISRALSYCGFGTQFAPELEEGDRLADAPRGGGGYGGGQNRFGAGPGRPMTPGGNGFNNRPGGNSGGGGMPPRPNGAAPMNRGNGGGPAGGGFEEDGGDRDPFVDEAPAGGAGDDVFAEDAPAPAPRAAAPARPAAPPAPAPAASARPAPAGAPIQRVKEPERDYSDPGGDGDEEDFDPDADPFNDENAAPAPRAASARPSAPPQREEEAAPSGPPKPNKLAANKCSVEGCPNILSPSQLTISQNKFGKAICMVHQKDPSITGAVGAAAAAVNTAGGGNRRPAGRSNEPQEALL